ncbi:MAG: SprT-like domain-containing protein [Alphaproteobacteria bacterium]|nr:SprT-like domain-containing protein [Alphaproteobacteria bacterium]
MSGQTHQQSGLRPGVLRRASHRTLQAGMLGAGRTIAALACLVFVFWDADWWVLRDKVEHIRAALFGAYLPPECREDPTQCVKDPNSGRLIPKPPPPKVAERSTAECKGPEGLELHCQLHTLFDYFNEKLFDGRLPKALITLQRKEGAGGFYAHQRFRKAEGGRIDEIALNPSHFAGTSTLFLASILVHEMVHMEQAYFGKPGKGGFHNDEWGRMMKRVGLHPSSTGNSGGKQTGTRMSHYIIPGGDFERAARSHPLLQKDRLAFYE